MSDTIQSDRATADSNKVVKGPLPQEAAPRTKRKLLLSLLGAAIVRPPATVRTTTPMRASTSQPMTPTSAAISCNSRRKSAARLSR